MCWSPICYVQASLWFLLVLSLNGLLYVVLVHHGTHCFFPQSTQFHCSLGLSLILCVCLLLLEHLYFCAQSFSLFSGHVSICERKLLHLLSAQVQLRGIIIVPKTKLLFFRSRKRCSLYTIWFTQALLCRLRILLWGSLCDPFPLLPQGLTFPHRTLLATVVARLIGIIPLLSTVT